MTVSLLKSTINLPIWTGGQLQSEVKRLPPVRGQQPAEDLNGGSQHPVLFGDFSPVHRWRVGRPRVDR
jgi:hypothetical protein